MGKVKLLGVKTIRSIKKRLRAGESSYSIAKDYDVTPGHIRKVRKGSNRTRPSKCSLGVY
jgi:hypothetical protein